MLHLLICLFRSLIAALLKRPVAPEVIEPSRFWLRMEISAYALYTHEKVDAERLLSMFERRIGFGGCVARSIRLIEDPYDDEARAFQTYVLQQFPDIVVTNECSYEYVRDVLVRLRQAEQRLSLCTSHAEKLRAWETKQIVDVLLKSPTCPISHCEITDPVVLACGHVFERSSCAQWMHRDRRCPMCRELIAIINQ